MVTLFEYLVSEQKRQFHVTLYLDLAEPEIVPTNSKYIKGNLLDNEQLSEAVEDCELVFHTASAGMSGAGQLCQSICEKVNVQGTQWVLLGFCLSVNLSRKLIMLKLLQKRSGSVSEASSPTSRVHIQL